MTNVMSQNNFWGEGVCLIISGHSSLLKEVKVGIFRQAYLLVCTELPMIEELTSQSMCGSNKGGLRLLAGKQSG